MIPCKELLEYFDKVCEVVEDWIEPVLRSWKNAGGLVFIDRRNGGTYSGTFLDFFLYNRTYQNQVDQEIKITMSDNSVLITESPFKQESAVLFSIDVLKDPLRYNVSYNLEEFNSFWQCLSPNSMTNLYAKLQRLKPVNIDSEVKSMNKSDSRIKILKEKTIAFFDVDNFPAGTFIKLKFNDPYSVSCYSFKKDDVCNAIITGYSAASTKIHIATPSEFADEPYIYVFTKDDFFNEYVEVVYKGE